MNKEYLDECSSEFEIPIKHTENVGAAISIIGSSFNEHYKKMIDNHSLHLINMCEKIDEWNIANPESQITEEIADFAYREAMKQLDSIVEPFIHTLKSLKFKQIRDCFFEFEKELICQENLK